MIYTLELSLFEKKVQIDALLDTGNFLREPITGVPVVIVEKEALSQLIPNEIIINSNKIIGGDTSEIDVSGEFAKYISRFRIIPFSSVGKQNGLLLGIKIDSIKVILDDAVETTKNIIIGIYDKSFTKNKLYSAIFGLDILEGSSNNEDVSNIKI